MSGICNQEDQDQCRRMLPFCHPLGNKAGGRSLNALGGASGRLIELSQHNEPSRHAPSVKENTEFENPLEGNSLEHGTAVTSSQDNTFNRSYFSSSMGKSPDAPVLSPMLKPERRPLESPPPTPPRRLDRYPMIRTRAPETYRSINGVHTSQRTRLLVFIKIILKCLDCEDPSLHLEAKQIITECTRKNREGIPGYDSLSGAITQQLRIAVGEVHWNRAQNLMSHYMKSRTRNELKLDKQPNYYAAV